MIATSFARAMLTLRKVFSRSLLTSAAVELDTGTTSSTTVSRSSVASCVHVSVIPPTTLGVFRMPNPELELTRLRGHLDTWDQESHKEAHYAPEVHPGVPARVPC